MSAAGARLGERLWGSASLLLVVATLTWSGNFVVGRAVRDAVPPIALAFWRWAVALLLIVGFAWPHLRRDRAALWASWRVVVALSALGVAAFNTLVYIGLHTTTAINALLLQSTMPLVIVLCSFLIFRERVRSLQLVAVAISLAGVVAIVARGSVRNLLELSVTPGDGWVFLAVVGYALYSVLLKRRPRVHPLSLVAVTFALGTAMLLPPYLWEHLAVEPLRPGPTAFAAIAYVAVFPSLVAYLCYNRAVELIGANRTGQYLHLMPVFGTLLAALFLGEMLRGYHLVGIALIGAGIWLAKPSKGGA